ncbi:MAG: tetratricopeptide repeat protein [Beutenbergiaceae bacterium]
MSVGEGNLLDHDIQLGWTLYDAQPTNPQIATIARRALAAEPSLTSMQILLAKHHWACGDPDEGRRLLLQVVGLRDGRFLHAVRELVQLEQHQDNYEQARHWAEIANGEAPDVWHSLMELGGATAMTGQFDAGWQLIDDALAMCAADDSDNLASALSYRALLLLRSFAPPQRLVPATEEALRADPATKVLTTALIWGYLCQARFADAQERAVQALRLDPLDEGAASALTMMRNLRQMVEEDGQTLEDLHRAGIFDRLWVEMREQILGHDLTSALGTLEAVLPASLRAVLLPPLAPEVARTGAMKLEIATWHGGQRPGAGTAWGLPGDFRLIASEEISAFTEAIDADPAGHPQWQVSGPDDYCELIMTDDAGAHLIEMVTGPVVIRRAGKPDEAVAPSLADWFWSRVVAFGGHDPRPPFLGHDD